MKPGSIVGAIAGEGGVDGRDIGNIEIFPTFSLVEISGDLTDDQLRRIGKGYVQGRPLRIRVDQGPGKGGHRSDRERSFDKAKNFDRSGRPERDRGEREYARRYERDDKPRRAHKDRNDRFDHHAHHESSDRRSSLRAAKRSGSSDRFRASGRGKSSDRFDRGGKSGSKGTRSFGSHRHSR